MEDINKKKYKYQKSL